MFVISFAAVANAMPGRLDMLVTSALLVLGRLAVTVVVFFGMLLLLLWVDSALATFEWCWRWLCLDVELVGWCLLWLF